MEPECKDFLKIRDASSDYMTIDTFIQRHPDISEKELNECYIKYRGKEQTYKENTEEYCAFFRKDETDTLHTSDYGCTAVHQTIHLFYAEGY